LLFALMRGKTLIISGFDDVATHNAYFLATFYLHSQLPKSIISIKMNDKRVVITGLGVIAPNGIGKEEFWKSNIAGKSGISLIKGFDTKNYDVKIAGEISRFNPLDYLEPIKAKRMDRFAQLGVAAAKMALSDSKIDLERENKDKIGVCLGSGLGGALFHEEQMQVIFDRGPSRANPLCVPRVCPNAVGGQISIEFDLRGPNITVSTACASGTHAIGQAFDMIRWGRADVLVAGGAEAPLTPFTFAAYSALQVLSKRNEAPEKASRPFDKERDGFVLSEGAGIIILEELNHAKKRGAYVYAELIGYGLTSGAYNMVIPLPSGNDAANSMRLAIDDAKINLEDIDYINAHGTSTQMNDKTETKAIKDVFGKYANKLKISSTKSMIGHSIGAAGSIEAIICALVIENGIIPPTINYETVDPECDLDYIPNHAKEMVVNNVLSNSFGFGSTNATIVLKRHK